MNRLVAFCNRCRAAKYFKDKSNHKNIAKFEKIVKEYNRYIYFNVDKDLAMVLNDRYFMKDIDENFLESGTDLEKRAMAFLGTFTDPKLINAKEENYVTKFFDLFLSLPKNEFSSFYCYCTAINDSLVNKILYRMATEYEYIDAVAKLIRKGTPINTTLMKDI